jgi:DNA (cytosine-5)-methyltransferase 1
MGLHRAGFDVIGVDIKPQPEYPFTFYQADALEYALLGCSFVWASPICQRYTAYKRRKDHVPDYDCFIVPIRQKLKSWGGPYVIENVPGAPLRDPFTLCGSMFDLDVKRHRIFESNVTVPSLTCRHEIWTPRFPPATNRKNLRKTVEVGVWRIPLEVQHKAMGIDWMRRETLSQAIPPAYAEFIGKAALKAMGLAA